MGDYISREAAIELAQDMGTAIPLPKTVVEEVFNKIPSADVRENVRGYLEKRKDKPLQNWYQCSNCGAICGETPKYCSECGADMRGDKL